MNVNITVNSTSLYLQEKKNGTGNNEKEDHDVISYEEDKVNKSKAI